MKIADMLICLSIAVFLGSGCTTMEGETPTALGKIYVASAYTLNGCQEKLNEEAGTQVTMTEQTDQVATSVLNYGLQPAYICHGLVPNQPDMAKPQQPTM